MQRSFDTRQYRPQAVRTWLRMLHVVQKIGRAGEESCRRAGLTNPQFGLLAEIERREGLTQQELAEALHVTKSNVCQILDRLEERDLIARQKDGRESHIFLTGTGRGLVEGVLPQHDAFIAESLAVLSADEQCQLHDLLRKLDRGLR